MGIKLLKRKKSKQSSSKDLSTPSKAGTKNSVSTPDTEPGSPVPDEDVILPASTPNALLGPSPTPHNKRIMEGETPLVSNVASSPQLNRNSSGVPQLSSTQVKSNQIRDEIGEYYAQRDAKEMSRQQQKKKTVMRTYAQPVVGIRAFSINESEEVELQLSSDVPFATHGGKRNNTSPRPRPVKKVVPKFVSKPNQDELSIPSVITGPDGDASEKDASTVNENKQKNEKRQGPESTWSKVSLTNKIIDGGQTIDDAIKSLIGGDTTQNGLDQMTSAAAQAGGIEQLLGLLQCNEDTTCGAMLQCDELCAPVAEKDLVDLENEQEQEFAVKFNNQIIRDGIKVIYHEPPQKTSTTSDWTQSTVKIFLRPGDCHNKKLSQPSLVWAVLQVASRFNDDTTFNTEEKCLWHRLELMDVDRIAAAPEEQRVASQNEWSPDSGNSVSTSTFFSVTSLSTGAVYIFEAGTVMERDYIIRGMKGIISRLAFNIIAGNTDVIGEHYSEDAGQMTGELPSLRSPRQALRDLTHAFLDHNEKAKAKEVLL